MRQNENSYTSSYTSKLSKKSFILPDDSDLLPCCLDTSLSLGWSCIFFLITKKPYFSYSDITAVRKNQSVWQFILVVDFLWILIQWLLCKLSFSCISTLLCDTTVLRVRLLKWQMKLVLSLDIPNSILTSSFTVKSAPCWRRISITSVIPNLAA